MTLMSDSLADIDFEATDELRPQDGGDTRGDRGGRRYRPNRLARRWWARLTLLVGVVVLLVVGGGGAGTWFYLQSIEKRVQKVDAFHGLPETQRPVRAADSALNFLVVGVDASQGGISRTDTIMLVHVPRARDRAQLISIPRDTWTAIPASADGTRGGIKAKINAAYAWGGVPLLVGTVERFTGVRIEHVALFDFAGFVKIIDVLGGVDVTVDRAFTTTVPPGRTYPPGVHHMDSAVALDYARQRKQFADGDFSRVRHQQAIVAAVLQEIGRQGLLANPIQIDAFLQATAGAVQVDYDLAIFDTIWAFRHLTDITMLTSPSSGTGMVGDQSVVFPDMAAAAELYQAVRSDAMDDWLAENPR